MIDDYEPSPLGEASSRKAPDGRTTLVLVRLLRHPPEVVWSALTDPSQVSQWSPFTPDDDLSTLGETTLIMRSASDGGPYDAVVSRAEPHGQLEYTWGEDLLVWELEAHDGGTRLTLSHTVSDPSLISLVASGWHVCLDVAERLLDGNPITPIVGEAAMDYVGPLVPRYAARLGVGD